MYRSYRQPELRSPHPTHGSDSSYHLSSAASYNGYTDRSLYNDHHRKSYPQQQPQYSQNYSEHCRVQDHIPYHDSIKYTTLPDRTQNYSKLSNYKDDYSESYSDRSRRHQKPLDLNHHSRQDYPKEYQTSNYRYDHSKSSNYHNSRIDYYNQRHQDREIKTSRLSCEENFLRPSSRSRSPQRCVKSKHPSSISQALSTSPHHSRRKKYVNVYNEKKSQWDVQPLTSHRQRFLDGNSPKRIQSKSPESFHGSKRSNSVQEKSYFLNEDTKLEENIRTNNDFTKSKRPKLDSKSCFSNDYNERSKKEPDYRTMQDLSTKVDPSTHGKIQEYKKIHHFQMQWDMPDDILRSIGVTRNVGQKEPNNSNQSDSLMEIKLVPLNNKDFGVHITKNQSSHKTDEVNLPDFNGAAVQKESQKKIVESVANLTNRAKNVQVFKNKEKETIRDNYNFGTPIQAQNSSFKNELNKSINCNNISNQSLPIKNKKEKLVDDLIATSKSIILLINSKWKDYQISVTTELKNLEDFNNSTFSLKKKNSLTNESSLYSVKYFHNNSKVKIELNDLGSSSLNIKSFYNIYQNTKRNLSLQAEEINSFRVLTNLELDIDNFKKSNITVMKQENTYKLVVDKEKKIFKSLQGNHTTFYSLAKIIFELIGKSSGPLLGIIKKYHLALINEKIISIGRNTGSIKIGKFHKNFIENRDLSTSAIELRNYLRELRLQITEDVVLNLPKDFGEEILVDENPKIEKIEDLTKRLVKAITDSLQDTDKKITIKKHPSTLEDLQKLAEHVLKKVGRTNTVVFSDRFLNDEFQLPGNLNLLRKSIMVKLEIQGITMCDLKKCQFSIKRFDYIKSHDIKKCLPELEDEDSVEDFFDKLEFIVEKTNIDDQIRINFPELKETNENHMVSMKQKLTKWFDSEFQTIHPFQDLINVSLKKKLSKNITTDIKVNFKNEILDELRCELNKKNQIILVETESLTLSRVKIYQILRSLFADAVDETCLFITLESLSKLDELQNIYTIFTSTTTNLLVVECDAKVKVSNMMDICGELKNIVKSSKHNPNLLIVGNLNEFPEIFKLDCLKFEDKFNDLKDLTEESLREVYESTRVVLHRRPFKIKDIMDEEIFKKIINTPALLVKILDGKYSIDKRDSKMIGFNENTYIEKNLKLRQVEVKSDELFKENFNERIVIISAETGCGKSTTVHHLEKKSYLNCDFPRWSVRIHLNNVDFNLRDTKIGDINAVCSFITKYLKYDSLRENIFVLSATGEINIRLTLFFDGFEELVSEYSKVVLDMLEILKSSHIEKIFVTSSPDKKEMLEKKFGTFAYEIEPFSQEDKNLFLIKYWTKSFKDVEERYLHGYIEYFLRTYSSKEINLTSTPLFLTMLAEINKKNLKQLPQRYDTVNISNYFDLYQNNYEKILKLALSTDNKLLDIQKFSFKNLLNVADYKTFILENKLTYQHKIQYISHITHAEFFVAQYFAQMVDICDERMCCYIDKIMINATPVFFSCIVEQFDLRDQKEFKRLATFLTEREYLNFLDFLLKLKISDDITTEELLHTAIEKDCYLSTELLINHTIDTFSAYVIENGDFSSPEFVASKLYKLVNSIKNGKSALYAAARYDHLKIACQLLLHGSSIEKLDNTSLRKIASFVALEISENCANKVHKYHSIAEKLFVLPGVGNVIMDLPERLFGIIAYFFTNGSMKVIESIALTVNETFSAIDEFSDTLKVMNLVKFLNENKSLSESDRLTIIDFLLRKTDNKNEKLLQLVLKNAIVQKDMIIFENLIDCYKPNGYVGFVKHCLSSNLFEIIEVLLAYHHKFSNKLRGDHKGDKILHIASGMDISLKTLEFVIEQESLHCQTNNFKIVNCKNLNSETPLAVALKKGADLSVVKHLIKRGAELNTPDKTGMFVWCNVIIEDKSKYNKEDQMKILKYFINDCNIVLKEPLPKGQSSEPYDTWREEVKMKHEFFRNPDVYDLNIDTKTGTPRLHTAISLRGKIGIIKARFLINHGADVNIKNSENKSALHLAIELKNHEVSKLLLENGAIFWDRIDETGNRLFKQLLKEKSKHKYGSYNVILDVLIKLKDLFSNSSEKFRPVVDACFKSFEQGKDNTLMRYLVNCRNHLGYSLLHLCAVKNCVPLIHSLLDFNLQCRRKFKDFPTLSVDAMDQRNNTPLHIAAYYGHKDVVAALMAKNAGFEIKNVNGVTPMELAKKKKHEDVVELIDSVKRLISVINESDEKNVAIYLDKYPSIVNAKDCEGKTPLHHAVLLKNTSIIKQLLSRKNIRVNTGDFLMKTPLHYAVDQNNLECVKVLLEAGAIIDFMDKNDKKPFDLLGNLNDSAKMLRSIYKLFEDINCYDPSIFVEDHPEILIDYLERIVKSHDIKMHVIVNVRDFKRNYLLHYAVKYDYKNSVISLLRNGAIYNAPNKAGHKPAYYAKSIDKMFKTIDRIFEENLNLEELSKIDIDKDMISKCHRNGVNTNLLEYALEKDKSSILEWLSEYF